MKKTPHKKLAIELTEQEFDYVKTLCTRHKITLKDFVSQAIIRSIEDYEDKNDRDLDGNPKIELEIQDPSVWKKTCREMNWEE